MCLNKRKIRKPDGRILFVKCGVCDACQQERANRVAMRIENNKIRDGKHLNLFLTLTYDNKFIPYVYTHDVYRILDCQDDGYKCNYIPVYRDYQIRRVRKKSLSIDDLNRVHYDWFSIANCMDNLLYGDKVYRTLSKNLHDSLRVGQLEILPEYLDYFTEQNISELRPYNISIGKDASGKTIQIPNNDYKVGVLLNSDIQNFWKRLDINLKRKYKYYGSYSRFSVGEYGKSSYRPHFHAILQIPSEDFAVFYQAIFDSWKYSSPEQLSNGIEVECHAASYVASYLCKSSDVPIIYKIPPFSSKYSCSQNYGLYHPDFSFASIVRKIEERNLTYSVKVKQGNTLVERSCLLPVSVLSAYFPKFKGFNKLTSFEIESVYEYPRYYLSRFARKLDYGSRWLSYTPSGERISMNMRERDAFFSQDDRQFLRDDFINVEYNCHKRHDFKINLGLLMSAVRRIDPYVLCNKKHDEVLSDSDIQFAYSKYAELASQVWTIYASNSLKLSFAPDNDFGDVKSRYVNYKDFVDNPNIAPTLLGQLEDRVREQEIFIDYNQSAYDKKRNEVLTNKRCKYERMKEVTAVSNHVLFNNLYV